MNLKARAEAALDYLVGLAVVVCIFSLAIVLGSEAISRCGEIFSSGNETPPRCTCPRSPEPHLECLPPC